MSNKGYLSAKIELRKTSKKSRDVIDMFDANDLDLFACLLFIRNGAIRPKSDQSIKVDDAND